MADRFARFLKSSAKDRHAIIPLSTRMGENEPATASQLGAPNASPNDRLVAPLRELRDSSYLSGLRWGGRRLPSHPVAGHSAVTDTDARPHANATPNPESNADSAPDRQHPARLSRHDR